MSPWAGIENKIQSPVFRDLVSLLLTLACASVVGILFRRLGIPAPYLLGSLFGVWLLSATAAPMRPYINIPRWFHVCVMLGLGVLIGAMFSPETLEQMLNWAVTVSAMLVSTLVATSVGYWYLTRRRGYDPTLALFCAIPGGQAEVLVLSREFVEKDYVVALCHLVRVAFVFCSVPLVLAVIMGESAVRHSNDILAHLPGLFELPVMVLAQFIGLALAGYVLARLIRAPVPFLTGPLFLSMGFHLAGLVQITRINEFVFLAQVTIGSAVGAKLGQVKLKVLAGYLRDAVVNVILVLIVFIGAAYAMSTIVSLEFFDLMLAFVPGGVYEVTLLSLIFGFDVAFVAIHHSSRLLLILFTLPFLSQWLKSRRVAIPD